MKVVIDIPEEDYKTIVDGYVKHELIMTNEVIKSIANGVVIPKCHGRLLILDEAEAKKCFTNFDFSSLNWISEVAISEAIIRADATLAFLSEVKLTIDNTPTVEQSYQAPKDYIRNKLDYSRPQGDLISRMWLKEHKFTTQVCNGLEIEDVDVVAVATIDNAPTVVNEYTKGFADGERSGDLLRQQCEKPLKQKKDSHQEYWDHIGEETNNE